MFCGREFTSAIFTDILFRVRFCLGDRLFYAGELVWLKFQIPAPWKLSVKY